MMKNLFLLLGLACVYLFSACSDSSEELVQDSPTDQFQPDDVIPNIDSGFIDIKLEIVSATATGVIDGVVTDNFWYQNQKIDLSFDGKYGTHFNSKGRGYLPVTLT